jgi:hypothetical protein
LYLSVTFKDILFLSFLVATFLKDGSIVFYFKSFFFFHFVLVTICKFKSGLKLPSFMRLA